MPIQWRDDENADKEPTERPVDSAMDELRSMFEREESGKPLSDEEIKSRFGDDALDMVARVQDRLGDLVDLMVEFNRVRKNGGDVSMALMKFTRMLSSTMQKYNSMEISSMLATGIAAIAEMEDRFGKRPD